MPRNHEGPYITDQGFVSLPLEWPGDPVLLEQAEHQALKVAQSIADTPHQVWVQLPSTHTSVIEEIVRGIEAHWTDPATRPPAAQDAIRAFRG